MICAGFNNKLHLRSLDECSFQIRRQRPDHSHLSSLCLRACEPQRFKVPIDSRKVEFGGANADNNSIWSPGEQGGVAQELSVAKQKIWTLNQR